MKGTPMNENKQKNDNQIIFLLKSMKKEYLNDTMKKGRFCFNHPTVYSKWEDASAAQYDRWEAHDAYEATRILVAPIIGEKNRQPIYGAVKKLADKAIIHMQSDSVKHTPLCCFRCISRNEFELVGNDMVFSLGETADRIIREFGHDTYVMIRIIPFLERLKAKVGTIMAMGVVYHDLLNDYQFNVPAQYKEAVTQLFRKDKKYEWQKEYRIALSPTAESPVFVELGSIEDIAICGNIADLKE